MAATDWTTAPIERMVNHLSPVASDVRADIRVGPGGTAIHRNYFDRFACLREVELNGGPARRAGIDGAARVVFWNVERVHHPESIGDLLAEQSADIVLLAEVDNGMARTGNRHHMADLAERLGHAYAYGVEFIECDYNHPRSKTVPDIWDNRAGFHGNGLSTDARLERSFLLRTETSGRWFDLRPGSRRVGSRMAIGGQVVIAGKPVTVVSAHLESAGDPESRAAETERLLDLIDAIDPAGRVIIGGDFNTSTASEAERRGPGWRATVAATPGRLLDPEPFEPLFATFAARGYRWRQATPLGRPTLRPETGDNPDPVGHLDWFFVRGLTARDAALIAAVDAGGRQISDHDMIAVTVAPD